MSGLTGIPVRRNNIVRPALGFSRAETRGYCEAERLWFHDDPANSDPTFARTRIRLKVTPELRRVNPNADEAVVRMASILAEEDAFLNGMAAAALEQAEIPLNGALRFVSVDCEVAFERTKLAALPAALLKRGLRLAVGAMGGSLDYDQTAAVEEGLGCIPRGSVTAEGGRVAVEWDPDRVVVRDLAPAGPALFPLVVPGETEAIEFAWRFTTDKARASDFARERGSLSVVIDAESLKGELHIRSAEKGDAVVPLGMQGRKKLSDIFGEAGLSLAARRRLPIVCDDNGPVWVPGLCLSDRVKVKEATRHALELRFGPQSPVGPSVDAT